ncbi:metallohydrolase [Pseudoalteromonas ostreae]|uniref:metallohydrolase n=1 Tax=Pseudoalteromonas ostreae TaxID=2774154 RepID=UPI001B392117|nr:metallohydrolase [Pseudoalteromonas ostreae]
MGAKITLFPVDNGDMTLIQLANNEKTSLLIDCNIRASADDPNEKTPDVAKKLRENIQVDSDNRPYVDAMLLSHPDKDHCLGLEKHFWLDSLDKYSDDSKPQEEKRIVIRQLWSSPMVFRRASKNEPLCSDAKAFNQEARRRVKENRNNNFQVPQGDQILILGEDENGKTDDLGPILKKVGSFIYGINGTATNYLSSKLLGPLSLQDEETEEKLSKNNSSVIINFHIRSSEYSSKLSRFLAGGDAGVVIWEKIWAEYGSTDLEYDLLLAPHHCSWRSLSHDSWSKKKETAKVSPEAKAALSQCLDDAIIVSSSKPIEDDDNDPPCIRAKREYKDILRDVKGIFKCTGEEPTRTKPKPLVVEATNTGFKLCIAAVSASLATAATTPPRAGSNDKK